MSETRILGDAMTGDATAFAREDYMEEAWRMVDPELKADIPVFGYNKNSWEPSEAVERVSPPGGWQNPTAADQEDFRVVAQVA